jgi:polyferredoxin
VRVLRPRIVMYGALLLALIAAWTWGVTTRSPLIVEVLRDRNALYRETAQGVENSYSLKLVNKTDAEARYRIVLETAPAGASLSRIPAEIVLEPQKVLTLPVTVTAPAGTRGRAPLKFTVESGDGRVRKSVDSSFFGPI